LLDYSYFESGYCSERNWNWIDSDKKERLRYGRMWIKRMINQAIRGSFECYINAWKEITSLDHVAEVNDDITNLDSSINMNLWALNEEMEYDMKIKEKVETNGKKLVNGKWIDLKYFIGLPNVDKDVVIDKTVVEKVNNLPNIEDVNIVVDPEFDVVEREDFTNINVSIMSDTDESDSTKRIKKVMQFLLVM
jgi:hypothetical protein